MSEDKNVTAEKNIIVIKSKTTPILVKKENKIRLFSGENSNQFMKNIKFGPGSSLYKENVIFQSKSGELRDSPVKVTIVNHLDILKNTTRTVISYYDQLNGKVLSEKNSDQIAKFIGQNNYEAVIAALCSVNDEEVKIKAIMALLTKESYEDQSTQTIITGSEAEETLDYKIVIKDEPKSVETKCCQTDENCMDLIYKLKQRKRIKRCVLTPYVVKDLPKEKVIKRVVVNPNKPEHRQVLEDMDKKPTIPIPTTSQDLDMKEDETVDVNTVQEILPELHIDETTNDSVLTMTGSLYNESILNPEKILHGISEHTDMQPTTIAILNSEQHFIELPNGYRIAVPVKPEYPYHMATPEILKYLNNDDKLKVVSYQAYLDYKLCLQRDSDGYLPIHNAVMNNDVDLLRRQCVVLRYRQETLDITAGNMTPLQMSILQDTPQCTAMLLQNGADPLFTDEEHKTCLHLASESTSDNLRAVINHCERAAREILQDNEGLWREEYENKSKEILAAILMKHMCEMSDGQGYTPLMLAAKSGNYTGVMMLIEASPDCINLQAPNSGNTALFLAVEGACHDSSNRGNKSKVADHFSRTISTLLENGADISIPTYSGTTINDLLGDNSNTELSTLFANKVTSKHFNGQLPYMLLKDNEGAVGIVEVNDDFRMRHQLPKKGCTDKTQANKICVADVPANKICITNAPNKILVINAQNSEILPESKIKKEKPIILENITLPQSNIVIDPLCLTDPQNRRITPKDNLVTTKQAKTDNISTDVKNVSSNIRVGVRIQPAVSKPNIAKNSKTGNISTKTNVKSVVVDKFPVVKGVFIQPIQSKSNIAKASTTVRQPAKRKSGIGGSGPNEKKSKPKS